MILQSRTAHPGTKGAERVQRIQTRLLLVVALLLLVMTLLVLAALLQFRAMSQLNERFTQQDMQRLLQVQALSLYTEGAGNALLVLLNSPRAQRELEYAAVDERNRRIDAISTDLTGMLTDSGQERTLAELQAVRAAYLSSFIKTVELIEFGEPEAALSTYRTEVQPAIRHMIELSSALLDRERERIASAVRANSDRIDMLTAAFCFFALATVVVSLLAARRMTRSIADPLDKMVQAARRIEAGDFSVPAPATDIREINQLGSALNAMTEAVATREAQIERLAFRDPLTDLPNRTFLLSAAMLRPSPDRVFMLMDLARLKSINETLGVEVGDEVIAQMARRFAATMARLIPPSAGPADAAVHTTDTLLARLSGGTLAATFICSSRAAAERLCAELQQDMARPVLCSSHSVDLEVRIGLSGLQSHSQPVASLLRDAEVALMAAKRDALPFAWFSPAHEAARLGHLSLLSDLKQAIREDQLQMWLQPKVDSHSLDTHGFEALVRWQHPSRGFISPAEFLPLAEASGAIREVTAWMLRQAVAQLVQWRELQPSWSIAVNLSTRDLLLPQFAEDLQKLMASADLPPAVLRLEITESGLMTDPVAALRMLEQLNAMGFGLSIDDFGTGYSSLSYLQRLPVKELKIDRSFVTGLDQSPRGQHLFKAMVDMAHGLGLTVTAEGVETAEERDAALALGCDLIQGYWSGRPQVAGCVVANSVVANSVVARSTAALAEVPLGNLPTVSGQEL
jgi:diguanylate cyclase (GGDEF)-like protein